MSATMWAASILLILAYIIGLPYLAATAGGMFIASLTDLIERRE